MRLFIAFAWFVAVNSEWATEVDNIEDIDLDLLDPASPDYQSTQSRSMNTNYANLMALSTSPTSESPETRRRSESIIEAPKATQRPGRVSSTAVPNEGNEVEERDERDNPNGDQTQDFNTTIGTTPTPADGISPLFTLEFPNGITSNSGCFSTFASNYIKDATIPGRNHAFKELKKCLKLKCNFKKCDKEKKSCIEKHQPATSSRRYKCWFFWYDCIENKCPRNV